MKHSDFIGEVTLSLFESLSVGMKPTVTWTQDLNTFTCTASYERGDKTHTRTRTVAFVELDDTNLENYSRIFVDHILRGLFK